MECSIIVVGDEILAGHVRDANGPFLIERIAAQGHTVGRVVIVGDDEALIAHETREQVDGPAGLVIVCGGLGPTHDDVTAAGVAAALGVPLAVCESLAELIDGVVADVEHEGFSKASFGADGFRKMASAPAGAELLRCDAGVMPAFAIEGATATVVLLPGPPRELAAVFMQSVESRYLSHGVHAHRREIVHPFPETTVAVLLAQLADATPSVAIGSYPRSTDSLIRLAGAREDVERLAEEIVGYIAALHETDEGRRLAAFMAGRRATGRGADSS